ncbi:MAG TPA: hypothetical protein DER26_00105 [Verrucomicrobia bacterium]|nr:hypothetical protein [Verrucomicrobiota bacterium]
MTPVFASPWAFLLVLPLGFAAWRLLRRRKRSGIKFSAFARLPRTSGGWRAWVAEHVPYALLAGLVLLVVAAARPRVPLAHRTRQVDALAIMMALDVSGSMEALDLTPRGRQPSKDTTRLAIVKKLFVEFVDKRPDDLIGLVTFGGYAATRAPLTADHAALDNVLRGVEVAAVAFDANGEAIAQDEQMTALGDGLSVAVLRLKDARPKSKAVILLSDGVSNTGAVTPEEAAQAAAKLGIRVYAIGIGTKSARTPFFSRDFFGRPVIAYADTTFDEGQLKSIAKKTGGRYFPVNDRAALAAALKEIDKLETTALEADVWDRWDEKFAPFLLGGVALLLAGVLASLLANRRVC